MGESNKTVTNENVNQGSIKNIEIAGDYLFVFSNLGKTYAYKLSDLSATEFTTAPSGFNLINVHYVNNKYYFAFVNTKKHFI